MSEWQKGVIVGIWAGGLTVLITFDFLLFGLGCASTPRQFNSDDLQNGNCYNTFGGMHGYCDQ